MTKQGLSQLYNFNSSAYAIGSAAATVGYLTERTNYWINGNYKSAYWKDLEKMSWETLFKASIKTGMYIFGYSSNLQLR